MADGRGDDQRVLSDGVLLTEGDKRDSVSPTKRVSPVNPRDDPNRPTPGTPDTAAVQPRHGPRLIADELAKLVQLRDSGVLSEDEFVILKTQLIQNDTEAS